MIKAGSLLYAIFITFLLTILSGSILLYVYFSSIIIDDYILSNQSQKTSLSAIHIFITNPNILESNNQINISPYTDREESVLLKRKFWGIYELIEAELIIHNRAYKNVVLIGKKQDNHPAIYLKKDINELKISGNTFIKGPCYVPNAIIRKTFIVGYTNPDKDAFPLHIKSSDTNLPELNSNAINSLFSIKTTSLQKTQLVDQKQIPDTLNQSFVDSTLILYSDKALNLSNKAFTGNIIIISLEKITVNPTCVLNNVILYAPQIEFLPGCRNTVQCFAEEEIILRENCLFDYPSCIAILNPQFLSTHIIIEDNCNFSGEIILDNKTDKTSSIQISENSVVNGLVYSNASIEHYGVVNGSIYTNQFIHKTSSTQYKNQLINATVDLSKLSEHYLYSSILDKKSSFGIIKWLN